MKTKNLVATIHKPGTRKCEVRTVTTNGSAPIDCVTISTGRTSVRRTLHSPIVIPHLLSNMHVPPPIQYATLITNERRNPQTSTLPIANA